MIHFGNVAAAGLFCQAQPKCQAYRRSSTGRAAVRPRGKSWPWLYGSRADATLERAAARTGTDSASFSAQKRYTIRRRPRHYLPVKRGSFRALYLYYLYLLSPRKKRPQKVPFETRAEIRRAKQYRQQFFLLQKYRIDTKPELDMLSDALSNEMQILVDRRKELYALRREQPSEQLDADIDALTAQLRPLRRELRLCGKSWNMRRGCCGRCRKALHHQQKIICQTRQKKGDTAYGGKRRSC